MPEDPQLGVVPAREGSAEQATPGGRGWFRSPERLGVVDSTNRYLADLARDGLPDRSQVPEGYAVVADRQTKGRGRLSRTWEAPAGTGLLCSILFRPDLAPDQLHLTAWAVALAVTLIIEVPIVAAICSSLRSR